MEYFYRCTEEDGETWFLNLGNLKDARETIKIFKDLPPAYGELRFEFFEMDQESKTIRTMAKFNV